MSALVAVLSTLGDLALLEEARRLYGIEAVNERLGIDKNTVQVWRGRQGVPPDKRSMLLDLVAAKRLNSTEREALERLTEIVRLLSGPTTLEPPSVQGKPEPGRAHALPVGQTAPSQKRRAGEPAR